MIKSTAYYNWSKLIDSIVQKGSVLDEYMLWYDITQKPSTPLHVDFHVDKATAGSIQSISIKLSHEETCILLSKQNSLEICVITAMVKAFQSWLGSNTLTISLSCHDRLFNKNPVDISTAIGWFTSIYPVNLSLRKADTILDAVLNIKKTTTAVR